jgi:hypothetical protein
VIPDAARAGEECRSGGAPGSDVEQLARLGRADGVTADDGIGEVGDGEGIGGQ